VAPRVPEFVFVVESTPHTYDVSDHHVLLTDLVNFVDLVVGVCGTVAQAIDLEAVQVTIVPAHRHLEDRVKFRQLDAPGHEKSAPDCRSVTCQADPQLEDSRGR